MAERKILAGDYTLDGEGYHVPWEPGDTLVDPNGIPLVLPPAFGEFYRDNLLPGFVVPATFTPAAALPFEFVGDFVAINPDFPFRYEFGAGTEGVYVLHFALSGQVAGPPGIIEAQLWGLYGAIPGGKQLTNFATATPTNLSGSCLHAMTTGEILELRLRHPAGGTALDVFHSNLHAHRIGPLS